MIYSVGAGLVPARVSEDNMEQNDVLHCAEALAEAFSNSPEYAAYLAAKGAAQSDAGLAKRIADYKKAHFEYQLRVVAGETPTLDEERVMSNMYSDLTLNGAAREFLEREQAVYDMINGINGILGGAWAEMDNN